MYVQNDSYLKHLLQRIVYKVKQLCAMRTLYLQQAVYKVNVREMTVVSIVRQDVLNKYVSSFILDLQLAKITGENTKNRPLGIFPQIILVYLSFIEHFEKI